MRPCLGHIPGAAARKAQRDLYHKPELIYDKPVVMHEAIVEPGELVIFPAGWGHYVVALDPSISISVNFVDSTNYLEHLMSISTHLPVWGKRIDEPNFRGAVSCEWTGRDFETLGGQVCV